MTKQKRIFTYLMHFAIVLMMCSCAKEPFIANPGTPVFTAEVPIVNEEGFEVVAGDELYYMFASHQESESEIVYSGLFGKEDICEMECLENFAIKLVQKKSGSQSLKLGTYDYYATPKDGFKHNYALISDDENVIERTFWRIGSQEHVGQSISYSSDNDSAPIEDMKLLYDVPGQMTVQFERAILPKSLKCDIRLKLDRVNNEGIFLEIETASPFSYVSWSNGKTGPRIKIDFSQQIYTANVFDASGCQTKLTIFFKTQNMLQDYEIGFSQESYGFETPDNTDIAVILEYTDGEGEFYSSSLIGQIVPFHFEILDIADYEINELGEATWIMSAEFDCILFGTNGRTKRVVNGKSVFAVSH